MPPHRIGFDAIRALRNTTGLGNYARGVLRGLRRVDPELDIQLYAPDPGRAEFRDLPGELDAALHLASESVNPLSRMLWRTFRLGRAAARDGIDLYHGLTHEIPRDLPGTRIPSVVSFHDLIYEKFPHYFRPIDRWSYRWRYRWSAMHATALIAVSEQTRDDLMEHYQIEAARIAVIPPARNTSFGVHVPPAARAATRTKYGLPAEYLFSLGTLEPRKNQRALIAALSALGPGDTLPLVLAGKDGGALRSLQAEIEARGLTRRVHILTNVATADLPALMRGATIFLYPSLVEGFGMPIVEALSAGVPVIAASGGCLPEAGGPGSRYLSPVEPEAWASAIADLAGDTATRAQMTATGLEWAAQFDGDRLAARILAVYDAVMADEAVVQRES